MKELNYNEHRYMKTIALNPDCLSSWEIHHKGQMHLNDWETQHKELQQPSRAAGNSPKGVVTALLIGWDIRHKELHHS
ncbi:hypothetical protein WJ0W_002003 [Paenibacillus melissococcoides]|uniref:Uncharacterized protein n=1 Tax=Paenibacillus melissococcoides TaxID=2912268 RepID=A0ABM9FZZ5_9BACL|nr:MULTISPECIES: hypothetical protein [Paenibacillus]MEB9893930.1 hypothetical protein [Bacillus cereus]CAH8244773.1 hypothetical protein WJ0W_002003 [Paenibacillus melissococcoides]CAH8708931.1 hypothetical protein WDD9_002085 [Paenibacillus melissococcoides]CAH8709684.1 hypothetical protein HTL2_002373 [Paenibacillus melissococcoides]GIO78236.1 hypothetical protein J6TS7_18460 [Paenibacillus dendritiformis]